MVGVLYAKLKVSLQQSTGPSACQSVCCMLDRCSMHAAFYKAALLHFLCQLKIASHDKANSNPLMAVHEAYHCASCLV